MSGDNNPEGDMERVLVKECRITPEIVALMTDADKPISNQQTIRQLQRYTIIEPAPQQIAAGEGAANIFNIL